MNQEVNFNHSEKETIKAFGIESSPDQLTLRSLEIVQSFFKNGDTRLSVLGEALHKGLPYNVILLIATSSILADANKSILESFKEALGINDDDEDDVLGFFNSISQN